MKKTAEHPEVLLYFCCRDGENREGAGSDDKCVYFSAYVRKNE